jgi:H+/Cl- antiporter ClcA
MDRLFYILIGIVWGIFGVLIIINPSFYHSGLRYHFDFSEIKWLFGGFLIVIGILFIWSSFRKKDQIMKE